MKKLRKVFPSHQLKFRGDQILNLSRMMFSTVLASLLSRLLFPSSRVWNSDRLVGLDMIQWYSLLNVAYQDLPFNLQPCHQVVIHVEGVDHLGHGKEDDEHVVDSDKPVTRPESGSSCWCVGPESSFILNTEYIQMYTKILLYKNTEY